MRLQQLTTTALCSLALAGVAHAKQRCPNDAVRVGTTCVDKYEASVWKIPNPTGANKSLVKKLSFGKATLVQLLAGGATQIGCPSNGLASFPTNFPGDGQWSALPGTVPGSPGIFAAAVPGVLPSTCLTWFQADQLCALSGKRLLSNAEWQRAATSTPHPGTDNQTSDCAIASGGLQQAGSRSNCVSAWGASDMVGNAEEWVSDWADKRALGPNGPCEIWMDGSQTCVGGDGISDAPQPAALVRGGHTDSSEAAGVFSISAQSSPSETHSFRGFRCGR